MSPLLLRQLMPMIRIKLLSAVAQDLSPSHLIKRDFLKFFASIFENQGISKADILVWEAFKVNLNSLPLPTSLSAHILPPCFSTNPLQSKSPNPVPISPAVPLVVMISVMSNNFDKF